MSSLGTCLRVLTPSHTGGFVYSVLGAGAGQVSTSQASQPTKPKSVHSNVKEDTSLPLGRSCDCGHFLTHLEGGKRLGCWLCHWKERVNPTKDTKLLPKTRWACSKCEKPLCLNDERNCFTEFHQLSMGGWIVVHEEGVGLLFRGVDFGGASEFTKPPKM